MTIIIFILILALLVLVHEFGHFITARKSGMKVYEFGFGFPPRAFGVYKDPITKKFVWVWGKGKSSLKNTVGGDGDRDENEFPSTLYSLNWLPLGGFCKIKGENGEEANASDSFGFQKWWKKVIVLTAGVTMNFILAGVLLSIGLMVGLPGDFSTGLDDKAMIVTPAQVMIQSVQKESPAEIAGLKYGDKIISFDDQSQNINSADLAKYVRDFGATTEGFNLQIARDGKQLDFVIKPEIIKESETPVMGITMADVGIVRYPWYIALYKGFVMAFWGLINIFVAFYLLIKNLVIGQGLRFDVAGPVGIAVMVGDSMRLGISYLINITAMLSLTLAAMNILPIPALDGGRVFFILLEKIIRHPLPMKYEQAAHTIGFILLMILIVVVTGRDILGLIK